MNADGSGVTRLTDNDARDDGTPAWSPDGRRIAFDSNHVGNIEIYVMNADGSGVSPPHLQRRHGDGTSPPGRPTAGASPSPPNSTRTMRYTL